MSSTQLNGATTAWNLLLILLRKLREDMLGWLLEDMKFDA